MKGTLLAVFLLFPCMTWAEVPCSPVQATAEELLRQELTRDTTRTVRFTTDEGTWMSLDVSPDGQTLVFDLLGNLYVLPIVGGRAERITSGRAFDSQPRFSPAGDRIVFISDRSGAENLWLVKPDGRELRALTFEPVGQQILFIAPEWTPDADSVVVFRTRRRNWYNGNLPRELRMYSRETGESRVVPAGGSVPISGALRPAFGATGRHLYFSWLTGLAKYEGDDLLGTWQLAVYDRVNGQTGFLTDLRMGAFSPTLSPDGRWLVYGTRDGPKTGLRIRNLETGWEDWLTFLVTRDQQEGTWELDFLPGASFTPDSRALILADGGKIWRIEVPSGRAAAIPFDAEVEQEVWPQARFEYSVGKDPVRVRRIRYPQVSPDGRRVVFSAMRRVWVMDLPDGTPRRLTDMEVVEDQPAWSPDGRHAVFVTWSEPEGGHLYRVRADGNSAPERLTECPAYYTTPTYSPKGDRIVFIQHPAAMRLEAMARETSLTGGGALRWIPAGGGSSRLISPAAPGGAPRFGDHQDRIYRYEYGRGLVSFDWDGMGRRIHFDIEGVRRAHTGHGSANEGPISEIVLSPGGGKALVQGGMHIYLVEVPKTPGQGPAPRISAVASPDARDAGTGAGRRLTTVGGDFVGWAPDGDAAWYVLGTTLFRHPLEGSAEDQDKAETLEVDLEIPRASPQGLVVLEGGRILTMGGGGFIERGTVLIEGDRIRAVGPSGTVAVPDGAQVIDVQGKTVIPGLIDSHCHARAVSSPSSRRGLLDGARTAQPWEYLNYLTYGVTTCHDPAVAWDVFEDADLIEAGWMMGPRLFATGPPLYWYEAEIQSLDDARVVLLRYGRYHRTQTIKEYVTGDRLQRQWLVQAARELSLTPTIEGEDLHHGINHILDGYPDQAHPLPVAPLHRDVLELARQAGTSFQYQTTTLRGEGGPSAMYFWMDKEDPLSLPRLRSFMPAPYMEDRMLRRMSVHPSEHVFPLHARQAADIVRAGGIVSVGDHGEWKGFGFHWELRSLAAGMPNEMVLSAATLMGAQTLGLADDLGSIEAGKLADMVVLGGNPLEDIRHSRDIEYVVKNGVVFEASTLRPLNGRPQQNWIPWWTLNGRTP